MSGDPDPRAIFFGTSIMAHGLDAGGLRLYHDEDNDAWVLFLDRSGNMSVRIDLKDDAATLKRNRAGLRQLAGLAGQLADAITDRLDERDEAGEGNS